MAGECELPIVTIKSRRKVSKLVCVILVCVYFIFNRCLFNGNIVFRGAMYCQKLRFVGTSCV